MPPSQNTKSRNTILLGLVGILAIQIPTTIALVEPAWLRAVFQVATLLLVVALSIKITVTEPVPKASPVPDDEADTLRDAPKSRLPKIGE